MNISAKTEEEDSRREVGVGGWDRRQEAIAA